MPISHEEVSWAYRMFLGREAEADPSAVDHLQANDRDALRMAFINSAEFRASYGASNSVAVGRFQDVSNINIDIDCSPEQRARMYDYINSEWRRYGDEAPHWSVLTGDEFKPDRIAETIDTFYASGRHHAAIMLNCLSRSGVDTARLARVMDFGCGVGRLTLALALAPHVNEITGVDFSPAHLALAAERAGDTKNVRFVPVTSVEDIRGLGAYDLIVSFIVLQHNPPPIMADILRNLLSCLAPGGCIIVQIPTFILGYAFEAKEYLDNPSPAIHAHVLPQHETFRIISAAECDLLEVREDTFLGGPALSHTFVAQRRPPSAQTI